jgi:hypothetical protein
MLRWILTCAALTIGCVPAGTDDAPTDDVEPPIQDPPDDSPEDPQDDPPDEPTGDPPGRPWTSEETIPDGLMPEDSLFRIDRVVEIRFDLTAQALSALRSQPTTYADATMRMFGQTFEVGIRVKGSSTFRGIDDKPSLKVDLEYSVPGQEIFGYEGFNLHNAVADASYVGEAVGHRMMRLAGVPSLKVGYARVSIDGVDKGLYTLVQRKDKDWLAEWFQDPEGSLYEGLGCDFDNFGGAGCWNVDQEGSADTRADLTDFVNAMAANGQQWWTTFRTRMDDQLVIRGLAAEWVIGHWDSYSGNDNNYHLYHEPTTDRWSLSPWSLDLSFSRPVSGDCHVYGVNRNFYDRTQIPTNCNNDVQCNQELETAADQLMTQIEGYDIDGLFDGIIRVIEPEVQTDPYSPGVVRFNQQVECARSYLLERRRELRLGP